MAILVSGIGKGRKGVVTLRLGKAGIIVRKHLLLRDNTKSDGSVIRISVSRRSVVEGADGIPIQRIGEPQLTSQKIGIRSRLRLHAGNSRIAKNHAREVKTHSPKGRRLVVDPAGVFPPSVEMLFSRSSLLSFMSTQSQTVIGRHHS